MRFPFFQAKRRRTTRERMIREHAQWLTRATRLGYRCPRIPVRKVSEGGFARLMTSRAGRLYAAGWWESALDRLPR